MKITHFCLAVKQINLEILLNLNAKSLFLFEFLSNHRIQSHFLAILISRSILQSNLDLMDYDEF